MESCSPAPSILLDAVADHTSARVSGSSAETWIRLGTHLRDILSGPNGVSVQEVGKPMNLTALEETDYEERAGFELGLGLVQNLTDDPGTIEKINIQGTVDGSALPPQTVNLPT